MLLILLDLPQIANEGRLELVTLINVPFGSILGFPRTPPLRMCYSYAKHRKAPRILW